MADWVREVFSLLQDDIEQQYQQLIPSFTNRMTPNAASWRYLFGSIEEEKPDSTDCSDEDWNAKVDALIADVKAFHETLR